MTFETMVYLYQAAISLSGLPQVELTKMPIIKQMPYEAMIAHVCKVDPDDCKNHPSIAGVFLPTTYEIVLLDSFDFDHNETDASFLVHELVHALQFNQNSDLTATCESTLAAEKQAYQVQNSYLSHHGQLYRAGDVLRFMSCSKGSQQ
jgi:hypothetical protein